jgi:hypothetical protein
MSHPSVPAHTCIIAYVYYASTSTSLPACLLTYPERIALTQIDPSVHLHVAHVRRVETRPTVPIPLHLCTTTGIAAYRLGPFGIVSKDSICLSSEISL